MPWCITCGKEEDPDWEKNGKIRHVKVGLIQYLKCKLKGHDCYFCW